MSSESSIVPDEDPFGDPVSSAGVEPTIRTELEGVPCIPSGWRIESRISGPGETGEADLYRVRRGAEVCAVKVYRRLPGSGVAIIPNEALIEVVRMAGARHLIRIHEHGRLVDGRYFELMELCEGRSLKDLVRSGISERTLREVVLQLAEALRGLHENGVAHRDLKPANVLLRRGDPLDLALADFGISCFGNSRPYRGAEQFTMLYASPSQLVGGVATSDDWWSLGVMVLEAMWREHPFAGAGNDRQSIQFHHANLQVDVPERFGESWQRLCGGLLAPRAADRWGYRQVLDWVRGDGAAGPTPSVIHPPHSQRAREPYLFAGVPHHTATSLGQAMGRDWSRAMRNLDHSHGHLLEWITDQLRDFDLAAGLKEIASRPGLGDDERVALSLGCMLTGRAPFWRGVPIREELLVTDPALLGSILSSKAAGLVPAALREKHARLGRLMDWRRFDGDQEVSLRNLVVTGRLVWKGAEATLDWLRDNPGEADALLADPLGEVVLQLGIEPMAEICRRRRGLASGGLPASLERLLLPLTVDPSAPLCVDGLELAPGTASKVWQRGPGLAWEVFTPGFAEVHGGITGLPWLQKTAGAVTKARAVAEGSNLSDDLTRYLVARVVFADRAAPLDGEILDAAWFVRRPHEIGRILGGPLPGLLADLLDDRELAGLASVLAGISDLPEGHRRMLAAMAASPGGVPLIDGIPFNVDWLADHPRNAEACLESGFLASWRAVGGGQWLPGLVDRIGGGDSIRRLSGRQWPVVLSLAAGRPWLMDGVPVSLERLLRSDLASVAIQDPFPEVHAALTGQDWLVAFAGRRRSLARLEPRQQAAGKAMLVNPEAGLLVGGNLVGPAEALGMVSRDDALLDPVSGAAYSRISGDVRWEKAGIAASFALHLDPEQRANLVRWMDRHDAPARLDGIEIGPGRVEHLSRIGGRLLEPALAEAHRILTGQGWLSLWTAAADKAGRLAVQSGLSPSAAEGLRNLAAQLAAGIPPADARFRVHGEVVDPGWMADRPEWVWDNLRGRLPELVERLTLQMDMRVVAGRLRGLEEVDEGLPRLLLVQLAVDPGRRPGIRGTPIDGAWVSANPGEATRLLEPDFCDHLLRLGAGEWLDSLRRWKEARGGASGTASDPAGGRGSPGMVSG